MSNWCGVLYAASLKPQILAVEKGNFCSLLTLPLLSRFLPQPIGNVIGEWAAALTRQSWEVQRHHAHQARLVVPLAFHQLSSVSKTVACATVTNAFFTATFRQPMVTVKRQEVDDTGM